jgi:hypothetical protein
MQVLKNWWQETSQSFLYIYMVTVLPNPITKPGKEWNGEET